MEEKYRVKALPGRSGFMLAHQAAEKELEQHDADDEVRGGLQIAVWEHYEGNPSDNLRALYEPDFLEPVVRVFVAKGADRDKVDLHLVDVRQMLRESWDLLEERGTGQRPRKTLPDDHSTP